MLEIELQFEDGTHRIVRVAPPVTLGRGPHCGIRIRHWRVGREHARLLVSGQDVVIEDAGTLSGTLVNGKRIARYGPLTSTDEVLVGPCLMKVRREPFLAMLADAPPHGTEAMPLPASSEIPLTGPTLRDAAVDRQVYGADSDLRSAIELLPHRQRLQSALLDALDLRRRDVAKMSDGLLRSEATERLLAIVRADTQLPDGIDPEALMRDVLDEALGFGPLSPLLQDPRITEIMVNRYDEIYVEREGRLVRHAAVFSSEQAVLRVLERIVAPIGRRIDESSPMVDARLADGSRVNAVVAPVALKGASLTIRKFPQRALGMQDLVSRGSLDSSMADFLARCVAGRLNIVVSGGTGSGKTTLLNILSNAIPCGERIITIEDAAELRLRHAHVVALEARPANMEGRGHITIRDLVRNALRMRPDRIVVGECRGAEAFDMLAAMNTGHEGSLTTLHANSPRDALGRLETMILMAGMDLPLAAVREHIASSIHLIVQQARLPDGRRLITAIVEVTGMEAGRIQTQPLFIHESGRAGGGFAGCGTMPTFADAWREAGRPLDPGLFTGRTPLAPLARTALDDGIARAESGRTRRAHGMPRTDAP
ncbi:FHA domain-containing protein [Bordetella sputigena]|uniref:ATPase, T2SS/T4P/T4SS family n=1 Tax=Bordetella sputigena TaxID=1416810 RepID=UPI0039EEC52F